MKDAGVWGWVGVGLGGLGGEVREEVEEILWN